MDTGTLSLMLGCDAGAELPAAPQNRATQAGAPANAHPPRLESLGNGDCVVVKFRA